MRCCFSSVLEGYPSLSAMVDIDLSFRESIKPTGFMIEKQLQNSISARKRKKYPCSQLSSATVKLSNFADNCNRSRLLPSAPW